MTHTTPRLTRQQRQYQRLMVAFTDETGARMYTPSGALILDTYMPHLSSKLDCIAQAADPGQRMYLFIAGGATAATTPPLTWWQEPLACGFRIERWHTQANKRSALYRDDEGNEIDVRMAANWFGDASAEQCAASWLTLERLARQLQPGWGLRPTPGATGADLLLRTLPHGIDLPPIPAELAERINLLTPQGRNELMAPQQATITNALALDAVWMYAHCVNALPAGKLAHTTWKDGSGTIVRYTPGFYVVSAKVPQHWGHIGLLPHIADDGSTDYPNEPGQVFHSFCSSAEAQLAHDHGWIKQVYERICWPEAPDLNVTKNWRQKLVTLRGWCVQAHDDAAAGAVRHMLLDTVGYWARKAQVEAGILPETQAHELPAGAIPHRDGAYISWERDIPLSGDAAMWARPEWAATVWGRARARLAAKALECDYRRILALRTDAIWLADYLGDPALDALIGDADPSQPGAWRVKHAGMRAYGAQPWPESVEALLALAGGEE